MEPLTWTGALGAFMNPITAIVFAVFAIAIVLTMVQSAMRTETAQFVDASGVAVGGSARGRVRGRRRVRRQKRCLLLQPGPGDRPQRRPRRPRVCGVLRVAAA